MKRLGLLIDYQQCSGCMSCVVACKQEHMYPAGKWGIHVEEKVFHDSAKPDSVRIDYLPFPTEFCDLCAKRTAKNEKPACVKACQSWCMYVGTVAELASQMEEMPRSVLYAR